jgi:hypothetical protein
MAKTSLLRIICAHVFVHRKSTHVVGRNPEWALQEIEAQNSISLSRTLGTPNIASKGVLEQRAVSIPVALFPPGHKSRPLLDKSPPKNLIEEVTSSPATASKVEGPNELSSPRRVNSKIAVTPLSNSTVEIPTWTWSQEGEEIHITIRVPKLVRNLRPSIFNLFQT